MNEIRLASFVSTLIEDVVASVNNTALEQYKSFFEMKEYTEMPSEEFAKMISKEDIEEAKKANAYSGDSKKIRLEIAQQQQATMRTFIEMGLPRVEVESGKIVANTKFNFTQDTEQKKRPNKNKIKNFNKNMMVDKIMKGKGAYRPENVMISINPTDEKSITETGSAQINIEINFKISYN